jgi:predicted NBD/HSP70 family sugar kinase
MVCGAETHRVETGPDFSPAFVGRLRERPACIGIAVPGLVQYAERVVTCDVLPKMTGWCATTRLAAELGCRVMLVNDVKAALAEEMHDASPGITAGIIMVGTAVGAALTEGKVLFGANGWAGELGYMPVGVGGNVKRLDELAGGAFMAARRKVSTKEFVRLAMGGETMALPGLWDAVQDTAARHSIPELRSACRLYRIRDDPTMTARGAVRCLMNPFAIP